LPTIGFARNFSYMFQTDVHWLEWLVADLTLDEQRILQEAARARAVKKQGLKAFIISRFASTANR
jgi:hypothetical protein